jgi:hypothetical protein
MFPSLTRRTTTRRRNPLKIRTKRSLIMAKPQREKPLVVTARGQTITMHYLLIIMVMSMLTMLALLMAMLIESTQFGYQKILLPLQRNPLIDGFLNPLLDFVGVFLRWSKMGV